MFYKKPRSPDEKKPHSKPSIAGERVVLFKSLPEKNAMSKDLEYLSVLIREKAKVRIVLTDFVQIPNLKMPTDTDAEVRQKAFALTVEWLEDKNNMNKIFSLMKSGCEFEIVTTSQNMFDSLNTEGHNIKHLFVLDNYDKTLMNIKRWSEEMLFLLTQSVDLLKQNPLYKEAEARAAELSSAERLNEYNSNSTLKSENKAEISLMSLYQLELKKLQKSAPTLVIQPEYVFGNAAAYLFEGFSKRCKYSLSSQGTGELIGPVQIIERKVLPETKTHGESAGFKSVMHHLMLDKEGCFNYASIVCPQRDATKNPSNALETQRGLAPTTFFVNNGNNEDKAQKTKAKLIAAAYLGTVEGSGDLDLARMVAAEVASNTKAPANSSQPQGQQKLGRK